MQNVTVDRLRLLKEVQKNREDHLAKYEKAIKEWRQEYVDKLELYRKRIIDLELGTDTEWPIAPTDRDKPLCYLNHYDRVISMLEMSVDSTVTLSSSEFDQFVNDNWGWKEHFTSTTAKYL